jgi:hypothetical protein
LAAASPRFPEEMIEYPEMPDEAPSETPPEAATVLAGPNGLPASTTSAPRPPRKAPQACMLSSRSASVSGMAPPR